MYLSKFISNFISNFTFFKLLLIGTNFIEISTLLSFQLTKCCDSGAPLFNLNDKECFEDRRRIYHFFVIAAIFVFRLLNSCTIKTYFDPDEYWQSIEISHLRVFGYGFKTWEWIIGLRSCLFTLPYIAAFYLIKICQFGRDIEDLFVVGE